MKQSILTLLLIAGLSAGAQTKHEISITLGSSTPVGDYASSNNSNSNAGYAKGGGNFRINYQFNVNDHFGLFAMLNGVANGVDNDAFASNAEAAFPGSDWNASASNWGIGGFQFGPVYRLKVSDKIMLEARGTIGFNQITSPEVTIDLAGNPGTYIKRMEAKTTAFVYSLGVGAKFALSERWFIPVHIDYMGCQANFDDIEVKETVSSSTPKSSKVKLDMGLNTINISGGIGFAF